MAKAKKPAGPTKCRALTAGWAAPAPGVPRKFISEGSTVEWPEGEDPPSWLRPVAGATAPKIAPPKPKDPDTLSELQQAKHTKKPPGA